jgi:hypothetical protein
VDLFNWTQIVRYDLAKDVTKEAQRLARSLGLNKVPIGRFEVLMNLVNSPKSLSLFTIRFEYNTMALTNLATFGVAAGATVLEAEVELKIDTNSINIYIEL